jgi:hypothetical protein
MPESVLLLTALAQPVAHPYDVELPVVHPQTLSKGGLLLRAPPDTCLGAKPSKPKLLCSGTNRK